MRERSRHRSTGGDASLKYAPGVGARVPPGSRPLGMLERITLFHVGSLLLLATWAFGGGSAWARLMITWWGWLSVLITLTAVQMREAWSGGWMQPLRWLWPLLVFNLLVLLSCLNPSFKEMYSFGESLLAHTGAAHPRLPSTAHAATSHEHLWLLDACYLATFNLALVIRQRRALRGLLLFAAGNAVALSVFGTFQSFVSAGLFFGLVETNSRFFATFVYSNHWAAFIVLHVAACAGLVFHYARRFGTEAIGRSPVTVGMCALLLMGITPALCGSRAGIIMILVLLIAGMAQATFRALRRRRAHHESAFLPLAGLAVFVFIAIAGAFHLGRDVLAKRWDETRAKIQSAPGDSRLDLYRDTWKLVAAKPAFGWGLGTYGKVFMLIRPRPLEARRQYEHSYVDAHSDWLQSLAEVGFVGTALLGLTGLLPLLGLRRRHFDSAVTAYCLAGGGLILLYALVEFPFGNPAVALSWWLFFFCGVHYARLHDREAPAPAKRTPPSASPAASAALP